MTRGARVYGLHV